MEVGLVGLLRTAWIASILPILIASIPCSRLNTFYKGLMGYVKQGTIMQSSSQRFSVPQKFFGHFYVAAVAWRTLLLVTIWMYAYKMVPFPIHSTGGSHTISVCHSVFLFLLMAVQVLRRLFETIYVFNYSSSASFHIFAYLTGYLYIMQLEQT